MHNKWGKIYKEKTMMHKIGGENRGYNVYTCGRCFILIQNALCFFVEITIKNTKKFLKNYCQMGESRVYWSML